MRRVLTMHDRCLAYARSSFGQKWADGIPYVTPTGTQVYGRWQIGSLFKNATAYPGCYPRTYVERVLAMFPDVPQSQVLHLFAGSLPKGRYARLDIRQDLKPKLEFVGSVYNLVELLATKPTRGPFRLVMADPPYPGKGRKLYGTADVQSWRAFRAMAAAFQAGTHVVWLDTHAPLYRASDWILWGKVAVERSTGQAERRATFFRRAT